MTQSQIIDGLRYIAESPEKGCGGFHHQAVKAAKDGINEIERLKSENASLKSELDAWESKFPTRKCPTTTPIPTA